MKLEKLLYHQLQLGRREARRVLADGLVTVDGYVETDHLRQVDEFTRVECDGKVVQAVDRRFLMVHKPAGYVSEVGHHTHPTVLDLLPPELQDGMHFAGRLDLSTTGLMVVTNDGKWSRRLTEPDKEVPKVYRVEVENPLTPEVIEQFAAGMYFAYEDITTRSAELEILTATTAKLTIHEGKYHQVKRMFHAVGNRVTALHRERIGNITLDIPEGEWRNLREDEIDWVNLQAET